MTQPCGERALRRGIQHEKAGWIRREMEGRREVKGSEVNKEERKNTKSSALSCQKPCCRGAGGGLPGEPQAHAIRGGK